MENSLLLFCIFYIRYISIYTLHFIVFTLFLLNAIESWLKCFHFQFPYTRSNLFFKKQIVALFRLCRKRITFMTKKTNKCRFLWSLIEFISLSRNLNVLDWYNLPNLIHLARWSHLSQLSSALMFDTSIANFVRGAWQSAMRSLIWADIW